jgi:hypothetical protein
MDGSDRRDLIYIDDTIYIGRDASTLCRARLAADRIERTVLIDEDATEHAQLFPLSKPGSRLPRGMRL